MDSMLNLGPYTSQVFLLSTYFIYAITDFKYCVDGTMPTSGPILDARQAIACEVTVLPTTVSYDPLF
jgi:hypothetical protein